MNQYKAKYCVYNKIVDHPKIKKQGKEKVNNSTKIYLQD